MAQQPQQPQQPHQFLPTIAENSDNSFPNINMRQPMNMRQPPSSPNKLYELNNPKKKMLVYYFIKDDITKPPKTGTITELPTLGMFGLGTYTVNNEKVEKVYTSDKSLGKEGTPSVEVVEVVAGVGGRRRKSKKMYKNKKRNLRKSRKSRKSSKRSRMH